VEDPCFTAVTARAAADLAEIAGDAELSGSDVAAIAERAREGLDALWDDDAGWFLAFDTKASRTTGPPTAAGLIGLWSGGVDHGRARRMYGRLQGWSDRVEYSVASTDPTAPSYDPIRYWRGPVWVLVNWLVADGCSHAGMQAEADALRAETRALVAQGFTEYYDPRDGTGIGGQGFSWSAALTLHWLTGPAR
jgi:neutral trehalase